MKEIILISTILITIILGLFVGIGYTTNIIKLTQCDFKPNYKCEAIRLIGIPVAPVGVILGYIDIK
jgi:hypothetical protein